MINRDWSNLDEQHMGSCCSQEEEIKGPHERNPGKRTKLATSHKVGGAQEIQILGHEWQFVKKPAFIAERNQYFDELYAAQCQKISEMPRQEIEI